MNITFAQMVNKLAKDGKDILPTLTPERVHLWHMASAFHGEMGELVEGIHAFRSGNSENLIEELGDAEFYLEGTRQGFGIVRDQVIEALAMMEETGNFSIIGHSDVTSDLFDLIVWSAKLNDIVKKLVIYEKPVDEGKLLEIMVNIEYRLREIYDCALLDYTTVTDANMRKLAKRYGSDYNYTNQAAQVRADKPEEQGELFA